MELNSLVGTISVCLQHFQQKLRCLSPRSESTSVKLTLQLSRLYSLSIAPGNFASHAHHVGFEPLITFQGGMKTYMLILCLGKASRPATNFERLNYQPGVVMIEFFCSQDSSMFPKVNIHWTK